jgi:hypothetical protein
MIMINLTMLHPNECSGKSCVLRFSGSENEYPLANFYFCKWIRSSKISTNFLSNLVALPTERFP